MIEDLYCTYLIKRRHRYVYSYIQQNSSYKPALGCLCGTGLHHRRTLNHSFHPALVDLSSLLPESKMY